MAQTKFDWEDLQTPFEIIDEWNRDKDKTDADLINFVKKLGIDDPDFKERRKKEWTSKEKSKKTTGFFENIKDRYEDTMMKLHGAEEVTEPYLHEGDWFRRKYTKAPGSRGLSLSQLGESERRDKAHKEFMLKKAESEVKEKEPELSMWQKIGKHFSENADDRDKLFQYLGSMGRELVKPIEPGKEAAGALIPTLSRGTKIAEDEYAAKQSAAAETALKYAEARQKMSPMQYMTSNMKDAAEYVRGLGIDPNTAAGRREISKYLVTVGITPSIVSMQEALVSAEEDLQTYMMSGQTDEDVIKQKQIIITNYRNKIGNLLQGSLGGSAVTSSMTDDDLYVAGAQPNSLKATTLETIEKGEFIPG